MAGFRKAKAEKAALKFGLYGLAGSGKTFTALLIAEGLAKHTKKRVAYVDTERGTDFYANPVPGRKFHPEAFDFDALYTRSITEVLEALKGLDPKVYGVIVLDSITHLWEAAINAYSGKTTKAGTIPFHAWGRIKKPYKDLMTLLLNSPMHVLICGRQGNEWAQDEDTEELKRVGTKMKAEGETPHEPDFLIHMEAVKNPKEKIATITAFAEKDRSGILAGQVISWPTFDNIAKPLLGLLGSKQAHIADQDETSGQDAEVLAQQEKERITKSGQLLGEYQAKIKLCKTLEEINSIGKEMTPEFKKNFVAADLTELRDAYLDKLGCFKTT